MTNALTAAIAATTEEVAAVEDLVERYEAARQARALMKDGDRVLMLIQQEVAESLKPGRTWAEVGTMLGVTGSRAEQVAKGR
jgi:NADH:ubiquinone oxidoreductase subunit E